jgi:hydroxymethylbilane synthase
MPDAPPFILATRGSALALTQANWVRAQCCVAFPEFEVQIKIIKTTGDQLQSSALGSAHLPKGLFTKELELALLRGEANLAVHSLKDLPTELPEGLKLGAVSRREDARDVLIGRAERMGSHTEKSRAGTGESGQTRTGSSPAGAPSANRRPLTVASLPCGAVVGTTSTRRGAQLLERRPDLKIVPLRGNVPTRLRKLAEQPGLDAVVLAAAGLIRLEYQFTGSGLLSGASAPPGLLAAPIEPEEMLPCVGQAAIGLEMREGDARAAAVCAKLDDALTHRCVAAERAFLKAMGGGCQVPVAAYGVGVEGQLWLRAVSFLGGAAARAEGRRALAEGELLGAELAARLRHT